MALMAFLVVANLILGDKKLVRLGLIQFSVALNIGTIGTELILGGTHNWFSRRQINFGWHR